MTRIAGIGGGTGLSALLRGLSEMSLKRRVELLDEDLTISAIVSVSDSGGSSGRLRNALGIPAVGDLRSCLLALASSESALPELFRYRFPQGDGLQGHSLGNLIVSALYLMSGSLGQAVGVARDLLEARGHVYPCTEEAPILCAELQSNGKVYGEAEITAANDQIRRIWLEPKWPRPASGVLETLVEADAIVLGPGSLYTSIVPNLLVAGVAEAIRESTARKIFVCNLMTQPGESTRLTAADHLSVLEEYLGAGAVDTCVLNVQPVEASLAAKYREMGCEPVFDDRERISEMGIGVAPGEFLDEGDLYVRHDPEKLAGRILSLARAAEIWSDARHSQRALVA